MTEKKQIKSNKNVRNLYLIDSNHPKITSMFRRWILLINYLIKGSYSDGDGPARLCGRQHLEQFYSFQNESDV
jgi:hypothetical protein